MVLSLITLNCNGLRSHVKRKALFRNVRNYKYDIICLQETYITDSVSDQWAKEWRGKFFFSPGTAHSKGQVVLFNPKFEIVNEKIEINEERILCISFCHNDEPYVIINIYGPNDDTSKLSFLERVQCITSKFSNDDTKCIISGDFNMVLDNNLDIVAGHPHDKRIVQEFNNFLNNSDLYDAWRKQHNKLSEFTWAKYSNPFVARRLDYILINSQVINDVLSCNILAIPNTDHKAVHIEIATDCITRGPSYWKFNDSLLKDEEYVKLINEKIEWCKTQLEDLPDQIKWDYCKLQIKDISIAYAKHKSAKRQDHLKQLRTRLEALQKNISNSPDDAELNEIKDTKLALDLYALNKAKGAQTRARIKWIEEGEMNTKYFLGLEKYNNNNNTVKALRNSEGKLCTNKEDIMQIKVSFYKNLYKEKFKFHDRIENYRDFCRELAIPTLDENKKDMCEGHISVEEASSALCLLKTGSAPGTDGLTTAFYKFFWAKLQDMVINSFNSGFQINKLSASQRRAVIILIHKGKNLPKEDLGNWRPISLTNTDYKILAKCLALRLQKVIPSLVSEDQVGYIKGRNISTIIRLIDDVIEYITINNQTGALVALDYSKAFDTIHKGYLVETFRIFGFGEEFISWVKTLMNETESCIQYCGWLSEFFPVNSGIRQGCNFSPLAFVLAVELLAIKLRQTNDVRGIDLPVFREPKEVKFVQYADDGTLMLKDEMSVKKAIELVEEFGSFSGLKLNRQKTEGMWLGTGAPPHDLGEINWKMEQNATLKILGIYFSNGATAGSLEINWINRIEKIIRTIKQWEKRNLSIIGKIQIMKTFLLSQLIYIMQAIILPDDVLKTINTILFKFIWKKKYSNTWAFEKVKRDVMCQTYACGGLNMINVIDMQKSFLITWVKKIACNPDAKYSAIPCHYYEELGMDLSVFDSNVPAKHFQGLQFIKSVFWSKVLLAWLDTKTTIDLNSIEEIDVYNQVLWNNNIIRYKGKSLMFKPWISAGYVYVGDLFLDDVYLTLEQLEHKLGQPKALLAFQYFALYNALPETWRQPREHVIFDPSAPMFHGRDIECVTTKYAREKFLEYKSSTPCCVNFWARKFDGFEITKDVFSLPFQVTKEVRLRVLQWKIIHNIYPTRILLYKMGKVTDSNCCFCKVRDFIEHFFCSCQIVRPLWELVETKLSELFGSNVTLSLTEKLFGIPLAGLDKDERVQINKTILVAKMCISKFKYGDYSDLCNLFEYEISLRKMLQEEPWLVSPICEMSNQTPLYLPGGNVGILVKSWPVCL